MIVKNKNKNKNKRVKPRLISELYNKLDTDFKNKHISYYNMFNMNLIMYSYVLNFKLKSLIVSSSLTWLMNQESSWVTCGFFMSSSSKIICMLSSRLS